MVVGIACVQHTGSHSASCVRKNYMGLQHDQTTIKPYFQAVLWELKVLKPWRWPASSNADSQCLLWCQHLPTLPLWHENQISRKDKQGWVVDPVYLCTTSRGFAFLQWLWIDKINETWAATAVRTHRPATNIGLDASQQGERVPPTGTKKPKEWHAPHETSSWHRPTSMAHLQQGSSPSPVDLGAGLKLVEKYLKPYLSLSNKGLIKFA